MGKPRLDALTEVDFRCEDCGEKFTAAPGTTEESPEQPYHPWFYTATCTNPDCRGVAEQDPRQRGLFKAWANATGPTSEEGKAKSAANLEGHPTPEETQITRMNSIKHGGYAKTLKYFPARPGSYASCDVCDYYGDICIKDAPSYHSNPKECLKKAEIFMRHQLAFEKGDPGVLTSMRAETQAGLQVMIDEMILQIAQDGGPRIKEIVWYHDKDGGFHLAKYKPLGSTDEFDDTVQIYEIKAHPLLKVLIDFISKNSLTLADMGMTPQVQQENDLLAGNLSNDKRTQHDREKFLEDQRTKTDLLKQFIENANKNRAKDPALIEYQQAEKDG